MAPAGEPPVKKTGVDQPVFPIVAGLVRLDVLGIDVGRFDAVGLPQGAGVDQCARARLVQCHPLALQVGHGLDTGALARHAMHALGVQVGDQPQAGDDGLALEHALAGVGPARPVALAEAGLQRATGNAGDIGQRAVAGLGRDDDLARLRHRIGDHAARPAVGTGGAASADAEKLLDLRGAGP